MSFYGQVGLHPDLVDDVIEELLDSNIISMKSVHLLKNDNIFMPNPAVIMDARHEQVNRKSTRNSRILSTSSVTQKSTTSSNDHHIRLQMMAVENEIQQFKKEVDYERQKLHLIAKLTKLGKSKLANRNNKICSPPAMPVTHVVTQLKTNIREDISIENTEPCLDENTDTDVSVNHTIFFQSAPLEVLSYKAVTKILPEIECPNHFSIFCPHRKTGGGRVAIKEITEDEFQPPDANIIVEIEGDANEEFVENDIACESVSNMDRVDCEESWLYENTVEEPSNNEEIEECFDHKRVGVMLRKYWNKWVMFTRDNLKSTRIRTENLNKSERSLQKFLVKLEERKKVISKSLSLESDESSERSSSDRSRESSVQTEVFTNRLQAQKSIIKEQKSKIEMQNKLIEQLKFEKIQQEIKASESSLRLNVIETLNNCEEKTKPAAKCLKAVISDINRGNEQKNCKFDFVTRMNGRAEQRKDRWNVIKEKRKMQEEEAEKERLAEEEKRKNDEEERRRKVLQEKKEKADLKKELERKKQLEITEYNRKCTKADDFYAAKLMNKVFRALRKNVSMVEDSLVEATNYFNSKMVKKCFDAWKNHSFFILTHKLLLAEAFCQYNLLQKCWDQWIMCHKESVENKQVAEDFFDSKVQERVLRRWKQFRKQEQITLKEKADIACNYYNRKLMKKHLDTWKMFPKFMYKERQKEQRIRQWHDKVQEILPDFSPVLMDDS